MEKKNVLSRRNVLKAGITSLALGNATTSSLLAAPKKPGEVRVLFLFGDVWHNNVTMEVSWRNVLRDTGWTLMFAQGSQFVTPELLADTDLFVFCRYGGPDTLGWSPEGIVFDRPDGALWMTEEQEDAIIKNVNRGMGLLPFHCAIWNKNREKYLALLGVKEVFVHGDIRTMTSFYDMNQSHPITRGVEAFDELDEVFDPIMMDVEYEPLYRARQEAPDYDNPPTWIRHYKDSLGKMDKGPILDRSGGFTREVGDGRIVYLNCGSTYEVFWRKSMKELMWRSAHWALKKDIPETTFTEPW